MDLASATAEQLQKLAHELTDEERLKVQKALELLETQKAEELALAEEVVQCLKDEFQVSPESHQSFLNGDRLFTATPTNEEVRAQLGDFDFLELAEALPAVTALATIGRWSQQNFPGFVKMLGAVVQSRDGPIEDRKVIGVIYEKPSATLEAYVANEPSLRGDHRMYLALTAFQAWSHALITKPEGLPVFAMENLVVSKNDVGADHAFKVQIRIQFPNKKYEELMGVEDLDSNVLQLADMLWFCLHGDVAKLNEMPRKEKPIDGEKVHKFSCRDFIQSLYELKSKSQTSPDKITKKMIIEYRLVREIFDSPF